MKTVTVYESTDGARFDNAEDAEKRDRLCVEVDAIMQQLGILNQKHGEFVQRDPGVVAKVKADLYQISKRPEYLGWWIDSQKERHGMTDHQLIHECHPSWFGRMLDGAHAPLGEAYRRLWCIDRKWREWDQPYFAEKADKEGR